MPKRFERIGERYERLLILSDTGKRTKALNRVVLCQCDCGKICEVDLSKLRMGKTLSCGCIRPERIRLAKEYRINQEVFDSINEYSAYWIGFLLADGNINLTSGKNCISIQLAIKDILHLEKFRDFIEGNQKIEIRENGLCRYSVGSKRIVTQLGNYGVISKKTFTASPSELLIDNRHFWRGMIDGDGCLINEIIKDKNIPRIILTGTLEVVSSFRDFLVANQIVSLASIERDNSVFRFRLGGQAAFKAIRLLYFDCNVALDRKMELAKQIIYTPSLRDCIC